MKTNKTLWITSFVILIPMLAGILFWDSLPQQLPTHWGVDGQADGWSGKTFAVFGVPLVLLAMQWICLLATRLDRNATGSNEKVIRIVLWIFPVMSLILGWQSYTVARGGELGAGWVMALLGAVFLVIGNYLPKCRQNSTIGIKLPWTFASEENWNKTHRLGGMVWVVCGVLLLLNVFVQWVWLFLAVIFVAVAVPTAYSWLLYRKQRKDGTAGPLPRPERRSMVLTAVLLALTAALVGWVLFCGDVDIAVEDGVLTADSGRWEELTVELDAIDRVEYRPDGVDGSRTWGYGSLRLLLGTFQNEEFGSYTRYTYYGARPCVVVYVGERVLVLGCETPEETQTLYEQLRQAQ